jgi:Glycosyltransferase family 87
MRKPLIAPLGIALYRSMLDRRWVRYPLDVGLVIVAVAATRLFSNVVHSEVFVDLFRQYARAFWAGHPPFHALPVEYPPLSLVPFSFTLLPPLPLPRYRTVYEVWMGALVLLGFLGFLRFSTRRRALIYLLYLYIGTAATLVTNYDIAPALVTLGALWAVQRHRFAYAYMLLAAGILLKLYPVFLVPIVMIEQWNAITSGETLPARAATRRVLQGAALCIGLVALGYLGPLLLNPAGTLSPFRYASDRPLEAESTPATLLWIGTFFGLPAQPQHSFGSFNYVGPLDGVLKPLSVFALLGGCLWVYWRQARGKLNVGRAFLACACVVIATNKVFSPQYLIWILPIVAAVEGLDLAWVAICLLTTWNFPFLFSAEAYHRVWPGIYRWQFLLVVALRNAVMLYVTIRALTRRDGLLPSRPMPAPRTQQRTRVCAPRSIPA